MFHKPYECVYFWMVMSGTPASEPSPHLMMIDGGAVVLLLGVLDASSKKSMAAVLMLPTERSSPITILSRIVNYPVPK